MGAHGRVRAESGGGPGGVWLSRTKIREAEGAGVAAGAIVPTEAG